MTTTCALCRLALWRADIFSANKRPQKKMRKGALQALESIGVSQLELLCPHFMGTFNMCVRNCVSICVQYNIFPFIGDCGVCGKMSVAHFHTPIVSQWACRCGGYSPWSRFHHIIHERRRGMETDCCVGLCLCVCEGQNGSPCGFFSLFFMLRVFSRGTVLPYLGHRGVWYCSQDNTSLNRTEAHRPSPPLRSPSAAEWRTKDSRAALGAEDADMETHAHPSSNTLPNVPFFFLCPLLRSERLTKPPLISFCFMCVHVIVLV